jgi:ABC-type oligopeptide transport system ATPase subunit
MRFPDRCQTIVGERGVKLFGGEIQYISIARVILRMPWIVLLDKAMSAVDSSTEAKIQETFKNLSTGCTTFIIAHCLSTIIDTDLILVVDNRKIVERGNHYKLLQLDRKYCVLWSKQSESKQGCSNDNGKNYTNWIKRQYTDRRGAYGRRGGGSGYAEKVRILTSLLEVCRVYQIALESTC